MLTTTGLRELAGRRGEACASLFLPVAHGGPDVRQNPIRLRKLLKEASERLVAQGVRRQGMEEALQPLTDAIDDEAWWNERGDGVALYAIGSSLLVEDLPGAVEELVVVGERPCIRPLARFLGDPSTRFFVLALSANRVRLLDCSLERAEQVHLEGLPDSLTDALGHQLEEPSLQHHVGSRGPGGAQPVYHGQGRGEDEDRKTDLEKFLRRVDDVVRDHLAPLDAPLLLAAAEPTDAIYREVSSYAGLLDEVLHGNPDTAEPEGLHRVAVELLRPRLEQPARKRLEEWSGLEHAGRTATGIEATLTAARREQVGELFLDPTARIWGVHHAEGERVEFHDQRGDGDEDLVDLAIVACLDCGAGLHAVDASDLPHDAPVAAMLRYAT